MLEQELVEHQRLARNDAEGVAVGRRLGAGARADIECPAGAVLDDERLAHGLVQLIGQCAHEDVAGAAGARCGDHAHGPRRIILRERRGERRQHGERRQPCAQPGGTVHVPGPGHCGCSPASVTTRPELTRSSTRKRANSSGVSRIGSSARSMNCFFGSRLVADAGDILADLSTIDLGVPAGATSAK